MPNFNLKDIEKAAVFAAVAYTKGNLTYARELLNVSKATLYRLIREYGVDYKEVREANDWSWGKK